MKSPWRGLFLLVILGPLLISVVARTLGWALLFGGSSGLVNKALMSIGADLRAAALHVHRDRHGRGAGPCADALHGAGGMGGAAAPRPADRERGGRAGRRTVHRAAPHRAAAGDARHPVRRDDRVRAGGLGLRHARDHRRPPAQGRLDPGLRRVPEHAQLAARRRRRGAAADRPGADRGRRQPPGRTALRRRCSDEPQRSRSRSPSTRCS